MGKSKSSADEFEDDSFNLDVFASEENLMSPFANQMDCPQLYEHHLHTVCAFAIKCQHESMPVSSLEPPSKAAAFWLPYVSTNQCYKYDKVAALMSEFFLKQLG